MIENKSVSIIIPVYNGEKHLSQCLYSLINQTHKNIKIIAVNDNSKDNSLKVLNEFAKSDSRITVINNKINHGVSFTRNCALEKTDTDYFCFVDCDDWVDPDYITTLLSLFDEDTAFTSCSYEYQKRTDRNFKNKKFFNKTFTIKEALSEVVSDKYLFGFPWNKMFRADTLKNNVRFDSDLYAGEDLVFCISYLLNTEKSNIKYTSKKLYHYTKTNGSASSMKCSVDKFNKQKNLFPTLENTKTVPKLSNNSDFCSKINSWIFLMSLQFTMYAKQLKLKNELIFFKNLSAKYLPDYKAQKKTYSSFRKYGVLMYNLIRLFIR